MPFETFSQDFTKAGEILLGSERKLSREPHLSSWISTLPTDSTLNCLLYNSPEYEASFPRVEGTLFFPVEGKQIILGAGGGGGVVMGWLVWVSFISASQTHEFFRISSSLGIPLTLVIERYLSKIRDTTGKD